MHARLLIPLSLSFGTLATGWSMWIAGTLIGTRAAFVVAAALLVVSLRALPRWWRDCRRVLRELFALGRRWTAALVALPLALAIPQLLLPIVDSDGLRYHVAFPKLFLLTGKVFFYPWDLSGAFPQTAEMIYMLRPESAKLIHFFYFLATLATLALVVHRRRRDRTAAVVAPFLLAVSPVVLAPAAAAFLDHVVLLHVAVAIHLLLSRRSPALPLAAAFATKYTAAPSLVLALTRRPRALAAAVAIVIAAFLPFAIRNISTTGDPVYPIGHVLLHKPLDGVAPGSLAEATQFHSKVSGIGGIPWTDDNAQHDEVVGLHHLLGLFALLIVLRERRLRPVAALVFVYLVVAAVYRPSTRHLYPMFFALAILEAAALARVPRKLVGVIAFVVCIPALLGSATILLTFAQPWVYLRGRLDRAHYLGLVVPGYRATEVVNALPPGGKVMALDFPAPYYFDRPWIVEGVLHEAPLERWIREGDALAKLREHDVRVLVLTPAYRALKPPPPFRFVKSVDNVDIYTVSR
jgi:Glycosyltransferase family 87